MDIKKAERILVYGMTNNAGGIETYLLNIFRNLDKSKVMFDFVTDFSEIICKEELQNAGAKIYYIPAKGKHLLGHWRSLIHIVKSHPEYKIFYFNLLDAGGVFSAFIPWLYGKKIIVHSHNGDTSNKIVHILSKPFLNKMIWRHVACSKVAVVHMFGKNCPDCVIIPNAIDAKKYRYNQERRIQIRRKWKLEDAFVVCHIGRMAYAKNPKAVIDIFDGIYAHNKQAQLLYAGAGDLEYEIKEYVTEKESKAQINFLGIRNDIVDILLAADVLLLPSFYEGLPIVAIEAQAAGLPCILSDRITKEICLTEDVYFVSLEEPIEQWVGIIEKAAKRGRKDTFGQIRRSGYDLSTINHYIEVLLKDYIQ